MNHSTIRRGLTLVEVLVVIAVIGILVGLLLPAVMQARSSARRSQCANNLKQLGAAVQQFHHRNDTLPVYWGAMKGAGGEIFGPWIMHLLPDLGEQPFYDRFQASEGEGVEIGSPVAGAMTAPAIPASPDYQPGTWVTSTTSVINMVGISIPVVRSELVGQVGTPAQGPWYEYRWVVTGTSMVSRGLHTSFAATQSLKSLDVLQCSGDGASVPAHTMPSGRSNQRWSLSNYQANAHVYMKFSGPRLFSTPGVAATASTMGGRFPRAISARVGSTGTPPAFTHAMSGTAGLPPRQFAHIIDGLSNTILFGEGMRQCDNGQAFRYAFLPTAERGEEHSFGIDVGITETSSGLPQDFGMAYGNTLMFQQRPPMAGCNKYRLQANHDGVLNVAMCDGSVRAISARVSRREQCDPDVAGREFGRDTYNPDGLGGVGSGSGNTQPNAITDGIWDMLMVPADPTGNVLANTGEIGKEK
jgi:prepilin-type N-terminal cleavage/methylation domain-containing protein/prepilin-type processing-associated H-X9-DG protein